MRPCCRCNEHFSRQILQKCLDKFYRMVYHSRGVALVALVVAPIAAPAVNQPVTSCISSRFFLTRTWDPSLFLQIPASARLSLRHQQWTSQWRHQQWTSQWLSCGDTRQFNDTPLVGSKVQQNNILQLFCRRSRGRHVRWCRSHSIGPLVTWFYRMIY